jgi:hypothetical protein
MKTKIDYKRAHDDLRVQYINLLKELAEESKERADAEERSARMQLVMDTYAKNFGAA